MSKARATAGRLAGSAAKAGQLEGVRAGTSTVAAAAAGWTLEAALPHGLRPDQPARVDAYLVWDLLTDFARHNADAAPTRDPAIAQATRWLPVTVQLSAPAEAALAALALLAEPGGADLAARLSRWPAAGPLSTLQTALVPETLIATLVLAVNRGLLQRFQLGAPCAAPPEPPPAALAAPAPPGPAQGSCKTLGLIDDGCCLAHQDFRDAQQHSRLLWLWDQNPGAQVEADGPWQRYAGVPVDAATRASDAAAAGSYAQSPARPAVAYGAELSGARISALLQAQPGLGEEPERALYARLGRPDWGPPDRSHGARVMHLLAGQATHATQTQRKSGSAYPSDGSSAYRATLGRPATQGPAAVSAPVRLQTQARTDGYNGAATLSPAADQRPILFVQLPAAVIADTSGDSLAMHVIDGARYIVARSAQHAANTADPERWQTHLVIALGGIAGPHDGSSLAELALDELAADARVQIVVAAGNAGDDALHIHALRSVRAGQSGEFFIRVPANQRRDSFVECWLPASATGQFGSFSLHLSPPGGLPATTAPVRLGQVAALRDAQGAVLASLVFAHQVAQGLNGTLVLLAIAPSAVAPSAGPAGNRRTPAPAGVWTLRVDSTAKAACDIHAWIERDDVLVGVRRPQQTRFELAPDLPRQAQYLRSDVTLSSLAHGRRVVRAGAMVASSRSISPYSSKGPGLGAAPQQREIVYAPGDSSPTVSGVVTPGFYSGTSASLNGTSAAAPQVARALAEGRLDSPDDHPALTDRDGRPLAQPPRAISGG